MEKFLRRALDPSSATNERITAMNALRRELEQGGIDITSLMIMNVYDHDLSDSDKLDEANRKANAVRDQIRESMNTLEGAISGVRVKQARKGVVSQMEHLIDESGPKGTSLRVMLPILLGEATLTPTMKQSIQRRKNDLVRFKRVVVVRQGAGWDGDVLVHTNNQ